MAHNIVLHPDTRFQAVYSIDSLRDRVAPFIQAVAAGAENGKALEESVLDAAEQFPQAAVHFVIDPGNIDHTFGLRDEFLYAERQIEELILSSSTSRLRVGIQEQSALRTIQRVLQFCSSGRETLASMHSGFDEEENDFLDALMDSDMLTTARRTIPPLVRTSAPGVHRLQHASLLYRTENCGILVDPHLHSSFRPDDVMTDVHRDQLADKVDAILISHFHEDHFFLSTLLMFPLDTPIVVPKVPRSTIICADMERLLRQCGFTNVIAVDWYSPPLRFKDVDVHVLPFFGEQPLRFEDAKDSAIRNWGNTYVIETDHYTSWFLIDSGADARGSMEEVAHYVADRFRKVDFVLSNLRRFKLFTPWYINGGFNWLTLSPAQMREFGRMSQHCITLGPEGVAAICRTVGARYYLPYAHWWGDVGAIADSRVDTPDQDELGLVEELDVCLRNASALTQIVHWRIGDGFLASSSRLRHFPLGA